MTRANSGQRSDPPRDRAAPHGSASRADYALVPPVPVLPPPRASWRWWFAGFAVAALLYLATMAPGITWQDPGEFQVRLAQHDWRNHPYGLARVHLVTLGLGEALRLALGLSPAVAATTASALCGAVTVANLLVLLRWLLGSPLAAGLAAALLAFAHPFWRFSCLAEAFTPTTALMTAEWLCLVAAVRTADPRWAVLLALCNGLGWANHNFALLSALCYGLAAIVFARRWWKGPATLLVCAAVLAAWVVGASPLLAMAAAEYATGGATLSEILRSLFVGQYASAVFNLRFGASDLLRVVAFLGLAFPTPIVLLAVVGVRFLHRRLPRPLFLVFVLLLIVHFLFAARYRVPDQYAFFIPVVVILALFTGAGLDVFLRRPSPARTALACAAIAWMPVFYALLPPLARRLPAAIVPLPKRPVPYRDPYAWFLRPWKTGYRGAERFGREALATLPPDALLIADSTTERPIIYLQTVEGLRRDVQVNRGGRQPWLVPTPLTAENLRDLAAQGRLYSTAPPDYWPPDERPAAFDCCDAVRAGVLYRLVPRQRAP